MTQTSAVPGHLPVVILPGIDGVAELRHAVAGCLSLLRPTTVVSLPAGLSRYDELARAITATLPAGPFVLLGESFSGPLAIDIAAREPQRVAGLVLAATFARNPWPRWLAHTAPHVDHRRIPRPIIEALMLGASARAEVRTGLDRVIKEVAPDVMAGRVIAALAVDALPSLRNLACPILCLHGRWDRLIRPRLAREIKAVQPRAELRWLDAPHMLLETHPDAAAAEIDWFCREIEHKVVSW